MTLQWVWPVLQASFIALTIALVASSFSIRTRWQLRNIKGPPPSWLFGNLLQTGKDFTTHLQMDAWYRKYGPVYKLFFGKQPIVVITDPDLLKQVFTKSFMKFHDRSQPPFTFRNSERKVYEGILFARGKYWSGIRAACEPLFHSQQLRTYAPVVNKAVDAMIAKLALLKPGQPVEINLALAGFTMDTIGAAVFGMDFKAQQDASSAIVKHSWFVFKAPTGKPGAFAYFRILIIAFPGIAPLFQKLMSRFKVDRMMQMIDARGFIRGASEALLESAKQAYAKQDIGEAHKLLTEEEEDEQQHGWLQWVGDWFAAPSRARFDQAVAAGKQEYAGQQPRDESLLHKLMTARRKDTGQLMTNGEICAQSFTFILAGYETTSMALTYALYELAKNPTLQQKVVDEVDSFGRDRDPTFDDLAAFPHLDAVFKESMRLHPPVTPMVALQREASEDVQLEQYFLPKGTRVYMNIYSLHHEEKNFPQALEFRPERFLEGQENHHPYAYIPFGAGPRKCIGYRFATMEGILGLVRLYQRFTFSLNAEKHEGKPLLQQSLITLMPKGGVWLNVHARS